MAQTNSTGAIYCKCSHISMLVIMRCETGVKVERNICEARRMMDE